MEAPGLDLICSNIEVLGAPIRRANTGGNVSKTVIPRSNEKVEMRIEKNLI